jgi:hypothetical protein
MKATILLLFLAAIALSATGGASSQVAKEKPKPLTPKQLEEMSKGKTSPPSGASFYIAPVEGYTGHFSMLLSDENRNFVSEIYSANQLRLIEAVMAEAYKFARNEEAVGPTKPVFTRFVDKQEPSFMVDVEKLGPKSKFYVTIDGLSKKLTVDCGSIRRTDPEATALFLTMMTRLRDVLASNE